MHLENLCASGESLSIGKISVPPVDFNVFSEQESDCSGKNRPVHPCFHSLENAIGEKAFQRISARQMKPCDAHSIYALEMGVSTDGMPCHAMPRPSTI